MPGLLAAHGQPQAAAARGLSRVFAADPAHAQATVSRRAGTPRAPGLRALPRKPTSCSSISRSMPSNPTRRTLAKSRTLWFSDLPQPKMQPASSARRTTSGFGGTGPGIENRSARPRRARISAFPQSHRVVFASSVSSFSKADAKWCGYMSGKSMHPSMPGSSPKWWVPTMISSSAIRAGYSSRALARPAARRWIRGRHSFSTAPRQNPRSRHPVGVRGPSSIRVLRRSMSSALRSWVSTFTAAWACATVISLPSPPVATPAAVSPARRRWPPTCPPRCRPRGSSPRPQCPGTGGYPSVWH